MSPSSCSTILSSLSSESAKRCSSSSGSFSNSCFPSAAAAFSISKSASHWRQALKTEISLSWPPHRERLMPQAWNDFLMTSVLTPAQASTIHLQIKSKGGVPSCYHPSYKFFTVLHPFVVEFAKSVFKWFVPTDVSRLKDLCATVMSTFLPRRSFFARGLMWHLKLSHTRSLRPDKFLSITSLVYISVKSSFIQLVPSYLIMSWPRNCSSSLIGRFLFSRTNDRKFSTVCLGG